MDKSELVNGARKDILNACAKITAMIDGMVNDPDEDVDDVREATLLLDETVECLQRVLHIKSKGK